MTCEENHEQRVVARVQALSEDVHDSPPKSVRPCDVQKLINSVKLRKTWEIDGIPNECLRHLPRRPLVHLTHLTIAYGFAFSIVLEGSKSENLTKAR
jgi:hypothetical protein